MNALKLKKILHLAILLTCFSWAGCGCMQPSRSEDAATLSPEPPQSQLQSLNVAPLLDLFSLVAQKFDALKHFTHAGENE